MIGFLRGTVRHVQGEWAILDVQGVGYEVYPTHADELSVGKSVELWIYTAVKEDSIQLFGFESLAERDVFLSLLKVSGIGPKLGNKILSACPWPRLVALIEAGDWQALTSIPKVGRKMAEQILVELKGKSLGAAVSLESVPRGSVRQEITSALVNLGYRLSDVERVVKSLPSETTLETGVREGLQKLAQL